MGILGDISGHFLYIYIYGGYYKKPPPGLIINYRFKSYHPLIIMGKRGFLLYFLYLQPVLTVSRYFLFKFQSHPKLSLFNGPKINDVQVIGYDGKGDQPIGGLYNEPKIFLKNRKPQKSLIPLHCLY